jgi:hypothetical protein
MAKFTPMAYRRSPTVQEFLWQLHRYESQPFDTKRCNYCYQVGVSWPKAVHQGVKWGCLCARWAVCYRELRRINLFQALW